MLYSIGVQHHNSVLSLLTVLEFSRSSPAVELSASEIIRNNHVFTDKSVWTNLVNPDYSLIL